MSCFQYEYGTLTFHTERCILSKHNIVFISDMLLRPNKKLRFQQLINKNKSNGYFLEEEELFL